MRQITLPFSASGARTSKIISFFSCSDCFWKRRTSSSAILVEANCSLLDSENSRRGLYRHVMKEKEFLYMDILFRLIVFLGPAGELWPTFYFIVQLKSQYVIHFCSKLLSQWFSNLWLTCLFVGGKKRYSAMHHNAPWGGRVFLCLRVGLGLLRPRRADSADWQTKKFAVNKNEEI